MRACAQNDLVDALEAIVTLALLSGMDTVEKLQCECHARVPNCSKYPSTDGSVHALRHAQAFSTATTSKAREC